jgi:hypothetical protein
MTSLWVLKIEVEVTRCGSMNGWLPVDIVRIDMDGLHHAWRGNDAAKGVEMCYSTIVAMRLISWRK